MKNKQLSSKNKNFFLNIYNKYWRKVIEHERKRVRNHREALASRGEKRKYKIFQKNLYKICWSNSEKEIDPSLSRDVIEERLLESIKIIDITTCEDCLAIG